MRSVLLFRNFKMLLYILFFLTLIYAVTKLSLNYAGFCSKQGRFISDQEKIDIAVNYILKVYPPIVDVMGYQNGEYVVLDRQRPKTPIFYTSEDEFFRINKNCCEVTEIVKNGDYEASLTSKLIGSIDKFVSVRYLVRYQNSEGDVIEVEMEPYVAISNCGHPWSGV